MYDVNFIVLFETVSRFGSLFAAPLPIRRMLPAGEQHRRPALLTQIQWVATAAGPHTAMWKAEGQTAISSPPCYFYWTIRWISMFSIML